MLKINPSALLRVATVSISVILLAVSFVALLAIRAFTRDGDRL